MSMSHVIKDMQIDGQGPAVMRVKGSCVPLAASQNAHYAFQRHDAIYVDALVRRVYY